MDETAFFVQFPHPGGEHNPPTDDMPWNADDHRRKFLIAPARYVGRAERVGEAELVFWGEWEPPSRLLRPWDNHRHPPRDRHLPHALHRPYWGQPARDGFRQNTDPWVFGEQMIYSNCRQLSRPPRRRKGARRRPRRPNSMQELAPGSVICFGSTIHGEFCVDTVFVVASAEPWVPARVADVEVDDAFKTCTADSIATRRGDAHLPLTLYRAVTFEDRTDHHGMFSFVPAKRADVDDPRFLRPPVESRFVNPSNRQSTWGSKRPLSMDTLRGAWQALRDQVLDAGLLLAVWLQTPDREEAEMAIGAYSRPRC